MFSAHTYIDRRDKLKKSVDSGILLFMGNEESPINYKDNCYHFRQDSTFLYFFGLDRMSLAAAIDLDSGEEIIFGNELSISDIVWTGPQPTIADSAAEVGIKDTRPFGDLANWLKKAVDSGKKVHFLPPYRSLNQIRLSEWLDIKVGQVGSHASSDLIKAVIDLRSVKSREEVDEMAKAVDLSRKLHIKAREMCHSGVVESQVSGVLHEIVKANHGDFAYPPIITVNGQTLHNHHYGNTLTNGKMLLVDAGAEVQSHYAGDITRTFPVDGKFSDQQRNIYQIVLESEVEAINSCRPGVTYQEIHLDAMTYLAGGLKGLGIMKGDVAEAVALGAHALFCPHGLGHMIGLDVHDMEDLGEDLVGYGDGTKRSELFGTKALRLGRELKEGFTFTVEPGLYFIPELIDIWQTEKKFEEFINYDEVAKYRGIGGIRIEDNVVITPLGSEIIGKPIPKELSEIEF